MDSMRSQNHTNGKSALSTDVQFLRGGREPQVRIFFSFRRVLSSVRCKLHVVNTKTSIHVKVRLKHTLPMDVRGSRTSVLELSNIKKELSKHSGLVSLG